MMMIVSTGASDEQVFLVVADGAATTAADGRAFHGSSDHEGKSAWFDSELNEESKRNGQSSNAKIMQKEEFDYPRERESKQQNKRHSRQTFGVKDGKHGYSSSVSSPLVQSKRWSG
jgi:hypothetical protein